jgi:ribosomal protein L12E/L44/L45/RPP1/RPP2
MVNVVAKPTPLAAEDLPTLSKFGYYLITSDLVPTYKDIVSKGDPLGLLGVVAKTSLSSQDFIPLAQSDIVQVLNQNTNINNIRVKILNPDLTNPTLNENSSVILRIDVPIAAPEVAPQPTTANEIGQTAKSAKTDKSEKKKKSKK